MISFFQKILAAIFGELNYQKYRTTYVARNSARLFAIQSFSILLVFTSNYVLIKTAGPDNYGWYVFVFNLVYLLLNFTLLGFDTLLVKKAATLENSKNDGEFKGLLVTAGLSILLTSVLGAAIFFIVTTSSIPIILSKENNWFVIPFISLLLLSAATLMQSVLQGRRKIAWSQIVEKIIRPVLLIILVGVFYYSYTSVSLSMLIWINIAASGFGLLVTFWFFQKSLRGEADNSNPKFYLKDWFKLSLSFLFIDILRDGNARISIFLLGLFRPGDDVGIFNIALRISELIGFSLVIVNFVLSPAIAKLYGAGKVKQLQALVTRCARVTLFIGTILFAGIFLFRTQLLSIFGTIFLEGRTALLLLGGGQIINILMGSVGVLLVMTGQERYSIYSLTLGLVINLLCNVMLTPGLGVTGAAISVTAGLIAWNFAMYYFVRKRLNIRPTAFGF